MKNWICLIFFTFLLSQAAIAQGMIQVTGMVLDSDRQTLPGAHVYVPEYGKGSVTNELGEFMITLPEGEYQLIISHIGYQTKMIVLDVKIGITDIEIFLVSNREQFDGQLLVTSGRMAGMASGIYNDVKTRPVEDHLRGMAGLDLVSRANFARDPVIRGQRNGRVDVMIDGMRMTPACVDGMDPLTAYVETDNLESIELERGHGSNGAASSNASGGSLNFNMARPVLDSGFQISSETGYQTASSQRVHQGMVSYGDRNWAMRISGTYRNAGDMMAGDQTKIHNSEFRKGNLHGSVIYRASGRHRFMVQYIGDFAGTIGYPALIMDTRRADAQLLGLEHQWTNPFSGITQLKSRIYVNTVEHWMDDYDRDVGSRDVMRNMYMPMYGETLTRGFSTEGTYVKNNSVIDFKVESYLLDAFADMWMEHLDPDVSDMYLVNLGDVRNWNSSISAGYTFYYGAGWRFGADARLETGIHQIEESSAISTYRAEYPDLESTDKNQTAYLVGLSLEKDFGRAFTGVLKVSDGYRLPDHMERYGYYIYQPLDGFFYIGNPGLKPERSSQSELSLHYDDAVTVFSGSMSVWVNRLDNTIAGKRTDQLFKRYDNLGIATLAGFEAEFILRPHSDWFLKNDVTYTFGQHNELSEPLPMIPPLKGSTSVRWQKNNGSIDARVRWASPQNRIAAQNSLETATDGYILLDLFGNVDLWKHLRLQVSLENIFDRYYVDHLSVNSLPDPGRNLNISLRVSL